MTEQEIIERVAEINAQRAALKEERNRLVWTEGVPAIIAKMKSMGKDTLCLRDGEDFFGDLEALWGYFGDGRGAANTLRLDENDNLILIYNYVWNHQNPDDSYAEYGEEDNEVIVDKEISNELIAPNIKTLLDTEFYERYGMPLKPTNMQSMFEGRPDTIMDLSSVDSSNVTDMSCMFRYCESLQVINFGEINTSKVTDMSEMFSFCSSLQSLDLSPLNTSKVTNMSNMFSCCSSLQSLDLSPLNTSKVTNMSKMFSRCSSLQSLDLSPLNTSKVTDMWKMFSNCNSLQSLDLSPLNTSKVTNMSEMFNGCSGLTTLDLSPLGTSKVEWMPKMFSGCHSLQSLDLSNFNITKACQIDDMFEGCNSLKTVIMKNCSDETVEKIKAELPEGVEIIR